MTQEELDRLWAEVVKHSPEWADDEAEIVEFERRVGQLGGLVSDQFSGPIGGGDTLEAIETLFDHIGFVCLVDPRYGGDVEGFVVFPKPR